MPQDKLTAVRIKQQNGQYGPQIPVGAKAENVKYDNMYSVKEVLGNVKTNVAPLQEQIDNINTSDVQAWIADNLNFTTPVAEYDVLETYSAGNIVVYNNTFYRSKVDSNTGHTPSAVSDYWDQLTNFTIDESLSVAGAAADAEQAGKVVTINSETDGNATKIHLNTTNDTVNVALMEDLDNLSDVIAEEFATNKAYAVGQYVFYDGNLYKFAAVHSAGVWNSSQVTQVKIGDEVTDTMDDVDKLKTQLNEVVTITESVNLADPSKTESGNISATGDKTESQNYLRSTEFIPVNPSKKYASKYIVNVCLYTAANDSAFVRRVQYGSGEHVLDLSQEAQTILFVKLTSDYRPPTYTWYFNEGNTVQLVPYTEPGIKLNEEVDITDKLDNTLTQAGDAADAKATGDAINALRKSAYDHGPFWCKSEPFTGWYTGLNADYTTPTFIESTKYADVINAFDSLMLVDSTVEKNTLGTASGTDTGGNQYTVYEYVFPSHRYMTTGLENDAPNMQKTPVILCDGSIHGFEKNSTYALYYFLRDLVSNYANEPLLKQIRESATIKVIPVVVPWGFDNSSYYNANGVNINRNFDTAGWTPASDYGAEPFDQPESTIVRDWILANLDNAMFYANIHTDGRYYASGYTNLGSYMPKFTRVNDDVYFTRLANVIQRSVKVNTEKLPTLYSDLTPTAGTYLGHYQPETGTEGTASMWGAEKAKLPCMTFEGYNGWKIAPGESMPNTFPIWGESAKKSFSELIGNLIAQVLYEYSN